MLVMNNAMNSVTKKSRPLNLFAFTGNTEQYILDLTQCSNHHIYSLDKIWSPAKELNDQVHIQSFPTYIDGILIFDPINHMEQAYQMSCKSNVPIVCITSILKEDVGNPQIPDVAEIYIHPNNKFQSAWANNKIHLVIPRPCVEIEYVEKQNEVIAIENNTDEKSLTPIRQMLTDEKVVNLHNNMLDPITQLQQSKYLIYPFKNINHYLLQAMKLGCNVIAPDCATIRTIIEHEKNGYLFNNLTHIKELIKEAKTKDISDSVRAAVVDNTFENFSKKWNHVFQYLTNYIYRG